MPDDRSPPAMEQPNELGPTTENDLKVLLMRLLEKRKNIV